MRIVKTFHKNWLEHPSVLFFTGTSIGRLANYSKASADLTCQFRLGVFSDLSPAIKLIDMALNSNATLTCLRHVKGWEKNGPKLNLYEV